jgi:hypothetical protein
VVVASIVSDADGFVAEAVAALRAAGLRAEADIRNEKINYKVREHSLAKVPVILAIGQREVAERTVTVRRLGDKRTMAAPLDEIVAAWRPRRRRRTLPDRRDARIAAAGQRQPGRTGHQGRITSLPFTAPSPVRRSASGTDASGKTSSSCGTIWPSTASCATRAVSACPAGTVSMPMDLFRRR